MNLSAYPKDKDSGVAWLGMVPEGWEVKKRGHLLSQSPERLASYFQCSNALVPRTI